MRSSDDPVRNDATTRPAARSQRPSWGRTDRTKKRREEWPVGPLLPSEIPNETKGMVRDVEAGDPDESPTEIHGVRGNRLDPFGIGRPVRILPADGGKTRCPVTVDLSYLMGIAGDRSGTSELSQGLAVEGTVPTVVVAALTEFAESLDFAGVEPVFAAGGV